VSFSQTTKHYSFTHLTLQEYLAARWFVKRREIPAIKTVSAMVVQFMAGILSKEKDSEHMSNVLREISSTTGISGLDFLTAKCLYEYQDKEFAKDYYRQYPINNKLKLDFGFINDVDCIAILFWLEILTELNEEENSARQQTKCRAFGISNSDLTPCGIKRICISLEKDFCFVDELGLVSCQLNDECVRCLSKLVGSKLSTVDLRANQFTSAGVASLSKALKQSSCKVTNLKLSSNQITDADVVSLCEALKHPSCKVTRVDLSDNQITDAGVAGLCEALKHPNCKVTTLNLCGNQITHTGVASLCESLKQPSCKITALILYENHVTDAGVASLSEALKQQSCKVTVLNLNRSHITGAGVASLIFEALKQPSCRLTTLVLGKNRITDAGRASPYEVLKYPSCRLTELWLNENQITDAGVVSLCACSKTAR